MNIKSLLLGSAAALVAVTGARAADIAPIFVEPDPVEYVRICDVYGAGFYYIPGTETCLQISGYVRMRVLAADNIGNSEGDDYEFGTNTRVRINLDVREETELGLLRGFARLQAQNTFQQAGDGSDASYAMDMGYLQLGGLTVGYLDTLWSQEDALPTSQGGATDLAVGDFQTNRISYTFAASGFSAAMSLEEDGTGDFAPDVVGLLKYEGGFGGAYITGSYDEEFGVDLGSFTEGELGTFSFVDINGDGRLNEFEADRRLAILNDPTDSILGFGLSSAEFDEDDDGAFAIKGGVSLVDLIAADSQLKIEGSYAFDPSRYSTLTIFNNANTLADDDAGFLGGFGGGFGSLPVEWSASAGYGQGFGPLTVAVGGIYGETFDASFGGDDVGEGEFYRLVGNVNYEVTSNFDILGEISYANIEFDEELNLGDLDLADDDDGEFDQTTGFVQFVRSF